MCSTFYSVKRSEQYYKYNNNNHLYGDLFRKFVGKVDKVNLIKIVIYDCNTLLIIYNF